MGKLSGSESSTLRRLSTAASMVRIICSLLREHCTATIRYGGAAAVGILRISESVTDPLRDAVYLG